MLTSPGEECPVTTFENDPCEYPLCTEKDLEDRIGIMDLQDVDQEQEEEAHETVEEEMWDLNCPGSDEEVIVLSSDDEDSGAVEHPEVTVLSSDDDEENGQDSDDSYTPGRIQSSNGVLL